MKRPSLSSKRPSTRTSPLSTDAEWEPKPDSALFQKQPGENRANAEMRVYYAWKRFMVDWSKNEDETGVRGLKELEGREVKDFVIT